MVERAGPGQIDWPERRGLIRDCLATWLLHLLAATAGLRFVVQLGYVQVSPFSDLGYFERYAAQVVRGMIPYRDFAIEYPPLAAPLFVAPKVAAGLLGGSLDPFAAYVLAFAAQMMLVDAVLVGLVAIWGGGAGERRRRLAWYSAYFVVLCPLVVARFDLVPALAAFAAAVLLTRGRPGWGGAVAGLGVLVKIVPGVVAVPLLAGAATFGTKAGAAKGLVAVVGAGMLAWFALGGAMVLDTFHFHADRGIELNSTYASAFMIAREALGATIRASFDHNTVGVAGPGSPLVGRASVFVQLACLGLVGWAARRRLEPGSLDLAGAAVLAFILGGKVLSPQFMIWLIPFVAATGTGRRIFLACCVLTTATYPWLHVDLCAFRRPAEAALVARNLALVWLFAVQLRAGPRGTGSPPGPRAGDPLESTARPQGTPRLARWIRRGPDQSH